MAKKLIIGTNDLASHNPELAVDWDPSNPMKMDEISYGSGKRVKWICHKCGHKWESIVLNRACKGNGCPNCRDLTKFREAMRARCKSPKTFAAEVAENSPDIELVSTYVDSRTKVKVRCKECGREWDIFPNNLIKGVGCRDCINKKRTMSRDEYVRRIATSSPETELIGEYEKTSTRTQFRCKVCGHEWTAVASSVLHGSGCPNCVGRKISEKATKSHAQFVAEMEIAKPTIQVIGEYKSSAEHVKVRCTVCGHEWDANPSHVLHDTGCPKCAGNILLTHEEFTRRVHELSPTIEILGKYRGGKYKIDVRCKTCGYEWSPAANSLMSGSGCIMCAGNYAKSHEQYVEELAKVNPNVLVVGQYSGANHPLRFKCKNCGGEWVAEAWSVLRRTGCPHCNLPRRSFFEHALLFALRDVLGEDEVLSRDRKTLGIELDIYIPSMKLAFEPGTWYFHKDRTFVDYGKVNTGALAGIKVQVIYDDFPQNETMILGAIATGEILTHTNWGACKRMIQTVFEEYGLDYSSIDWESVRSRAASFSGRKTTQQFIDEMAEINPDVEVLGEYVNANSHIKVRCRTCGRVWEPPIQSIIRGHGCIACARAKNSTMLSNEEYLERLKVANPNVEALEEYKGYDTRIMFRCKICGYERKVQAGGMLLGRGCPRCSNYRYTTHDEFVEKLKDVNDKVTVVGQYVNSNTPIEMRCDVCGHTWSPRPNDLLVGKGCPVCGIVKSGKSRRKTHDDFVRELAEKNPNVEAVGEYKFAREKIEFRCRTCGHMWYATPDNILRGRGCPSCKYKKRRHQQ